ncbi:MAG: hypothetical protein V4548_03180 [Bacteroidota bacterium]
MEEKYLNDISEIKSMMSKSSQFISLSGFAGIIAGIYAIVGAYIVNQLITKHEGPITFKDETFQSIVITAFLVLFLSVITAILLTYRNGLKKGEKIWNPTFRRMAVNFLIPLLSGGLFALLLIKKEYYELVAPVTLLFYGLACVNASKYTFRDVRYLGITCVILGIIATEFLYNGLLFWTLGFGVAHILYGAIMHFKYDRK